MAPWTFDDFEWQPITKLPIFRIHFSHMRDNLMTMNNISHRNQLVSNYSEIILQLWQICHLTEYEPNKRIEQMKWKQKTNKTNRKIKISTASELKIRWVCARTPSHIEIDDSYRSMWLRIGFAAQCMPIADSTHAYYVLISTI